MNPMASSNANNTVLPFWSMSCETFPIHLNPVSVSWNSNILFSIVIHHNKIKLLYKSDVYYNTLLSRLYKPCTECEYLCPHAGFFTVINIDIWTKPKAIMHTQSYNKIEALLVGNGTQYLWGHRWCNHIAVWGVGSWGELSTAIPSPPTQQCSSIIKYITQFETVTQNHAHTHTHTIIPLQNLFSTICNLNPSLSLFLRHHKQIQYFWHLGCFSATASRSASGSLASMTVESWPSAVLKDRSRALLPSLGLGKRTVGNSGSGSICSLTGTNGCN